MKADVTALDWVETTESDASVGVYESTLGLRKAERVPVRLQVAIAQKDCAYLAQSVDISENGILIENYSGPEVSEGDKLFAFIKGIIADEDAGDGLCSLFVARAWGTRLALSFAPIR